VATSSSNEANSALAWTGSISSIVGLVAVLAFQRFQFDDNALLFWWLTTIFIAISSITTCFTPPSLLLRAVFAMLVVSQLPAFDRAWGEIYERDTQFDLTLGSPNEDQVKIEKLEDENRRLKWQQRQSKLFWQSIAHLSGMGFALLGCTAAGQKRARIVYEDS
jgi:hypothetical protein